MKSWMIGCGMLFLLACGGEEGPSGNDAGSLADHVVEDGVQAASFGTCNVLTESCILPFPSSVFEKPDETSPTGRWIEISDEADFADFWSVVGFVPHDGFSPVSPIVTRLPGGVDPESIPTSHDASLELTSSVALISADPGEPGYGQRWPVEVEVIESEKEPGVSLLVLTPLIRLETSRHYVVVLTSALRDADGNAHTPSEVMKTLLAEEAPEGDLESRWLYYAPLRDLVFETLGLSSDVIVQMWDFHTRSDAGITSDFQHMAAFTKKWLEENPPVVEFVEEDTQGERARYNILMDIPIWREDWDSAIHRDDKGVPTPVRFEKAAGILLLPDNATEETPATPVFFGHGLSANMELMAPMVASMPLEEGPYVAMIANWDLHGERGGGMVDISEIAGSLNVAAFAGMIMQSAADSIVFSEALASIKEIPGRGAVIDSTEFFFLGQSLGGLIGVIGGTVTDRWTAAVFNVTGGGLSSLLRASFVTSVLSLDVTLAEAVDADPDPSLPSDLGVDLLLSISQMALDFGDPIHFAAHLLDDRFPEWEGGAPAIVVQESIGDGIVVNRSSEALARTLGLPLIGPEIVSVQGLELADAPTLGSPANGLTQFRTAATPFNAHLSLLKLAVQEQAMTYFASFLDDDEENDGNITYNCSGPGGNCDFLAPAEEIP